MLASPSPVYNASLNVSATSNTIEEGTENHVVATCRLVVRVASPDIVSRFTQLSNLPPNFSGSTFYQLARLDPKSYADLKLPDPKRIQDEFNRFGKVYKMSTFPNNEMIFLFFQSVLEAAKAKREMHLQVFDQVPLFVTFGRVIFKNALSSRKKQVEEKHKTIKLLNRFAGLYGLEMPPRISSRTRVLELPKFAKDMGRSTR